MKNKKNILVIAPHADDEVLGCGGYIIDQGRKGHNVHVLILCLGGYTPYSKKQQENAVNRMQELDACCKVMGCTYEVLFHGRESMMDSVDRVAVTSAFDLVLGEKDWDEVFLPYPSHHQDHKICYEQGMAALRHKHGVRGPRVIALYEYQFIQDVPKGGLWYHDISKWINDKVKAFECYESQMKLGPSPLNRNGIYALAQMRGMQGQYRFAERFYIQQWHT